MWGASFTSLTFLITNLLEDDPMNANQMSPPAKTTAGGVMGKLEKKNETENIGIGNRGICVAQRKFNYC